MPNLYWIYNHFVFMPICYGLTMNRSSVNAFGVVREVQNGKRHYTSPMLRFFGTLRDLTQAATLGNREQHSWQTQKQRP